jgi:hypothetical protein
MKRLDHLYRNPEARPEHARTLKAASPPPPSAPAARWRATGGRILRLDRSWSYADWLDERDARVPAPPDPPVRLVSESGKTIGGTCESNAERMAAALEPRQGPLTVVPA